MPQLDVFDAQDAIDALLLSEHRVQLLGLSRQRLLVTLRISDELSAELPDRFIGFLQLLFCHGSLILLRLVLRNQLLYLILLDLHLDL